MFPFVISLLSILFPASLALGTERLLWDSGQEILFWSTAPGAEFPAAAVVGSGPAEALPRNDLSHSRSTTDAFPDSVAGDVLADHDGGGC